MTSTTTLIITHILPILIQVESEGNPNAVNKKEQAVGVLQIRPIMKDECNRIYAMEHNKPEGFERWTLDDRLSAVQSTLMFDCFMQFSIDLFRAHFNRTSSNLESALMWNQGKWNVNTKTDHAKDYIRKYKRAVSILSLRARG